MSKTTSVEAKLIKAGELLYNSEGPVSLKDVQEFFGGLTSILNDMIKSPNKDMGEEFAKAELVGMIGFLEGLTKLSDADLSDWLSTGRRFDPSLSYDDNPALALFERMGQPGQSGGGWGATAPPNKDNEDDYTPTVFGHMPGSSSPSLPANKAVAAELDRLAGASPEDIEKARTGLSQLEPDESMNKEKGAGHLIQSLEGEIDPETEQLLRRGALLDEQKLRKSVVLNAVSLMERVAKLRDTELKKQVHLTGDPEDDFEARARQGNI